MKMSRRTFGIKNSRRFAPTLFLFAIAIGCGSGVANESVKTPTTESQTTAVRPTEADWMTKSNYEIADIYAGLRNNVLQLKPDEIGQTDADQSTVIAILMEIGHPEVVATLVAIADGTASLYISNGGAILGSGQHEPVREVSAEFLALAQVYVSRSTLSPTKTFPFPQKEHVRFYLVTQGGTYTLEAPEDDLLYQRHAWSDLFHKGHKLFTAIRIYAPN